MPAPKLIQNKFARENNMIPPMARIILGIGLLIACGMLSTASAEERSRKSSLPIYQPPTSPINTTRPHKKFPKRSVTASETSMRHGLVQATMVSARSPLKQVGSWDESTEASTEDLPGEILEYQADKTVEWNDSFTEPTCGNDGACDSVPVCGCESAYSCNNGSSCSGNFVSGCDSVGGSCDGQTCDGCRNVLAEQWFGSADLLLWWRKPQQLPGLVANNAAGTNIIFGNERVANEVNAGGRFRLGFWLDEQRCQSLVSRFWGLGKESYSFSTNSTQNPDIVRPFIDGSGAPDGQVISGPGRTGRISGLIDSEVYGADVSLRQLCYSGLGGHIDFMYGYQHFRMNESLQINSFTEVTGAPNPPPNGTTIDVTDLFQVENEFNGGLLGFSGRFREGCVTWDGMFKLAFGSLRRGANLRGQTTTTTAGSATEAIGLLVQESNRGNTNDKTFSWIPELNLNMIYHTRRNIDLRLGYSVVVVTDALQVPNAIDPNLQVDLGVPPTVSRPNRGFRYDDYWVQGIQFGIDYSY